MKLKLLTVFVLLSSFVLPTLAQTFLLNPYTRKHVTSLNGKWNAIIDVYNVGEPTRFYNNRKPIGKTDFVEYTFNDGFRLNVPGDFNSQFPELKFFEGNVWYERLIKVNKNTDTKTILYFAGANYLTKVWLNGTLLGKHEGGFFPFQFDITALAKEGDNDLIVLTNNNRSPQNIPAMNYDWWNYGGITRDVFLIETPQVYIQDYKVQLKKGSQNTLMGYVKLNGTTLAQNIELIIPELQVKKLLKTDVEGYVSFEFQAKPKLWEPDAPKLYAVNFISGKDTVTEEIGFRTIEVKGTNIVLNGKPLFLKGVNFHEEIAQRMGRAYSESDAISLLSEAKALGCNFVRTAHYPQNEYIVRMAEKMGIMIWEEIPLWQGIDFDNPAVIEKGLNMLKEMIYRDKNRAAIIIWSIANETLPKPARDKMLSELAVLARESDNTRLVAAAFLDPIFDKNSATYSLEDKLFESLDVVGINRYMGWYAPFPVAPNLIKWNIATGKPLLFSEFGGESLKGQTGPNDVASSWSEEYQEKMYEDNLIMFKNIPNLCGTMPWVLYDFRSPNRWHNQNQEGWNRKGLVSDKGLRKKAWYVMKRYYDTIGK